MYNLKNLITELALDTENPEKNYNLALAYESIGQTASASNYFYRCAERTPIKELTYECLLKTALCYDRQGNRPNTVKRMIQHALYVLPKRPEAYFLMSRFHERKQEYCDAYTMACMGLGVCDFDLLPLRSSVEYPGKYGLIFEKAVSGWWWGKNMEARYLFRYLAERFDMDETHTNAVYNNIQNLGIGPEHITHKHYKQEMWSKLRYQFTGSRSLRNSHGQAYQDIFVLSCLDGKKNGTYLEIGSAGPYYGNNTALLEEEFGWFGFGVDFDEKFVTEYRQKRNNPILHQNALEIDYDLLLGTYAKDGVIDYLQLDCEPSSITYEIMTKIPFDKYKFAVITYEHDHYQDRTKTYRKKSREYLISRGYELVVSDVSNEGNSSFEDWYVHPDLIDRSIIERMKDVIEGDYTTGIRSIDEYMFPDKPKEITFPVHIIKSNKNKKEYWRNTQWPTLEITTNIAKKGCVVDCAFCPQRILEKSYNSDKRIMTLDEFKSMIDKVPKEVRITFAGFTEPWLNKNCTDMVLYAHEKGHPVSVFTTGVGMTPEDVERLATIPYAGNPNGGFCLHLPDQEQIAKHPINANYIRTIEKFKQLQPKIQNFYTMCMSDNVHEAIKHLYPTAAVPAFWNRAGNLVGEAKLKPELDKLRGKWMSAPVAEDPRTCGCVEDLYHNVLLPNGDVSLCCMDYSLEYIIGNIQTQEYDDILPAPDTTYDMCRRCENGIKPRT